MAAGASAEPQLAPLIGDADDRFAREHGIKARVPKWAVTMTICALTGSLPASVTAIGLLPLASRFQRLDRGQAGQALAFSARRARSARHIDSSLRVVHRLGRPGRGCQCL